MICLNKRAHYLTCSHRACSSSSLPGSVVVFALIHLSLLCPVTFCVGGLGKMKSHSVQWKERSQLAQMKAKTWTNEGKPLWVLICPLIVRYNIVTC